MSNFTLVVINGENLNIYKQDTFDESIQKIVELKETIDNENVKWIFYKGNEIFASKDIE